VVLSPFTVEGGNAVLDHFAIAFFAHAAYDISKTTLTSLFQDVAKQRPDLERAGKNAMVSGDVREAERVFEEAVGVIVARAATGSINIDEATLTALKGIRFDHEHGRIDIGNSAVAADVLVTGGSPKGHQD
jgi:hypothetical protein